MAKALLKVFIFMLVLVGAFVWVSYAITEMTGGEKKAQAVVGVNPKAGEAIFWGKGRCHTCHSIGGRGSGVRCPNLGVWGEKFPLAIGQRTAERAKEREAQTGKPYTPLDYLMECIGDPGAYVVDGFKKEMPAVYAPPISLTLEEIKAVISYLQSQGGKADIEAIKNPPTEIGQKLFARIQAATTAGGGDPANGEKAFSDYGCMECHIIKGEGGEVGPDLTTIGTRDTKYISESILDPSARFTKGYETYRVRKRDGNLIVGVKKGEGADGLEVITAKGEIIKIAKGDIEEITEDIKSIMPEETRESLTVKDYQDILAFLILQKGQK